MAVRFLAGGTTIAHASRVRSSHRLWGAAAGVAALAVSACGVVGDPPVVDPEADPAVQGPKSAFGLDRAQPQLLPFGARLRRVASVAGVPLDSPILDELEANRIALGDYDFARGVAPDSTWTASRIALWAKSLRPVCASAEMRARYGALPAELSDLMKTAYGRTPTPEEISEITSVASEAGTMTDDERYEVLCLAVLSSAEFVIQ